MFSYPIALLTSAPPQALTQQFSQLLSQVLYSQQELRTPVLKGLKSFVESNTAIAAGKDEVSNPSFLTPDQATKNIQFLRTQAENWLAVLFNVFSSVNRDARGAMSEVITAWASIADEKVCVCYRTLNLSLTSLIGAGASSKEGA